MLLFTLALLGAGLPASPLLDQAEFVADPAATPPAREGLAWTRVTLPDRWAERRPGLGGPGWYRLTIDSRRHDAELWAVYLPSVNMNAAVFLNGTWLGSEGETTGDLANNWNRPLFFTFPRRLLEPGANTLAIEVLAHPFAFGGLGPVLVGPAESLRRPFERRMFLSVTLSRVASLVAALLCLWALATWLASRRQPVFGWFAAAMFWFVAGSLNYHLRDLPLPRPAWEWLVNVSIDASAVSALFFINRLAGLRRPRWELPLAAAWLAGAVVLALVPARAFYQVAAASHVLGALAASLCAWVVFRHVRRLGRVEAVSALLGSSIAAALALHDLAIQLGWLEQGTVRLVPHAISMAVLTFGTLLIARFVRALEAGRRHNAELAAAVRRRELELAAQFERVRGFEREQVRSAERERIMRDVHDGLGAHLASTLALAESPAFGREQIIEALRLISEELALLIDALDPTLDDLTSLLAILRGRIEPRLARSGVRFEWQVQDLPAPTRLSPDQLHHCMRIVQEAIANVIRHARAQTIVVRTGIEADGLVLEVRDDGVGLGPPRPRGRGLRNMQQRAHQIGGRLTITAANPGTAVVLHLPLAA